MKLLVYLLNDGIVACGGKKEGKREIQLYCAVVQRLHTKHITLKDIVPMSQYKCLKIFPKYNTPTEIKGDTFATYRRLDKSYLNTLQQEET